MKEKVLRRHPHAWGCKKTTSGAAVPRSKSGTGAALCLYRHAASNTCDHRPQAPYQSCHLSCSILVNTRYNLRLCVVFTVSVSWWQLPRCGPSSPKRLEQQGRQFCEPTCKKKWGEAKCISLPSTRHHPKPNLPYRCFTRYQPFSNNTTTFTRRGQVNCGLQAC